MNVGSDATLTLPIVCGIYRCNGGSGRGGGVIVCNSMGGRAAPRDDAVSWLRVGRVVLGGVG